MELKNIPPPGSGRHAPYLSASRAHARPSLENGKICLEHILFGWLEAFEAAKSCVCTGRSTMSPSSRPSRKPRLSQRRRGGRIETCASDEVARWPD